MGNQIKTTLLLGALTLFIVWIGNLMGGRQGMVIALVLAAAMNFFSYWYSDTLVLRMYRAQPLSPDEAPHIHATVAELARRAGLPMPRVFLIPEDAPNAFATGRDPQHAVVAVTRGLVQMLDRDELAGVLAHELGHVKNRDILIGSVAATLAGAVMVLASMARWSAIFGGGMRDDDGEGGLSGIGLIVMSLLAPLGAMLIQMAISRSREYLADATAAGLTGRPDGLARALGKLGAYSARRPLNANPATAHMFIVNPLGGRQMANLFATHPPLEERIRRLRGVPQAPPPPAGGDRRVERDARRFWDGLR